MKIIIPIEGPSGSGKSSLIKRLETLPNVGVVQSSLGKREFETQEAAIKSFLNDLQKISLALVDPAPVVIIDRWALSQIVYDAIRRNGPMKTLAITQANEVISVLIADIIARTHQTYGPFELAWLMLVPNARTLKQRRLTGGKEYPHSPLTETKLYNELTNTLLTRGSRLLKPRYEDLSDQDYIVKCFTSWLTQSELTFEKLWKSFALGRNFKL